MNDDVDEMIIKELQKNGRPHMGKLAKKLGITLPTLSRRVKRLLEHGEIKIIAVRPDPTLTGRRVVAVIGVSVEKSRIDDLCAKICILEEVTWAGLCYGRFDLLFIVYVDSQAALLNFIKNKVAAIEGVTSTETFYVPELKKRTPLAEH